MGEEASEHRQGNSLFSRLGHISEAVFEIFTDPDLRKKAQTMVYSEAGKQIKGIQEGVAARANTIQRVGEVIPRQLQGVVGRMQHKIQLQRREASLKARRDQPVDVQVGPFLWEDAPQELRSRLWIALLFNPHLIGNLVEEKKIEEEAFRQRTSSPGDSPNRTQDESSGGDLGDMADLLDSLPSGTPVGEQNSGDGSATAQKPSPDHSKRSTCSGSQEDSKPVTDSPTPSGHTQNDTTGTKDALNKQVSNSSDQKTIEKGRSSPDEDQTSNEMAEHREGKTEDSEDLEDVWEIVQDASSLLPNRSEGSRLLSGQLKSSRERNAAGTLRDKLLEATWEVEWPILVHYPEGCRYETLCQISVGQEEIEEVIERDIDRTFPEHPQFSFEQGQQQLFRVLKAYSLHDLQVGYCQGMAFVTGVILMYIPEEPAFRLLTRLMDERGANLRHLYLPGLEGLKNYLRILEWLLERTNPKLKQHLEDYGVSPVLFASQWFLTAFSCPFPAAFSCRVIDVMITENCGNAMLRVAMSVLKACSNELMQLNDFESLITHLKVEPVSWGPQKSRQVLNEAIQGNISDDLLLAASEAIEGGYHGSLPRTRSIRRDSESVNSETSASQETKAEDTPKLTLPNQISGIDKSNTTGLSGSAEQDGNTDGKMMLAMDALWLSNADETIEE